MKILKAAIIFLLIYSCSPNLSQNKKGWKELFNGENLEGWTQLGGNANYSVENGVIVGEAVPNTPNSFLTTDKEYSDFILEFEVYIDNNLNSGVQIRSESDPDYHNGRVHGYQVEIDPSDRSWSGGIYDEARRGWLYKLENNKLGRSAFKLGQWNHFRIEAIGPEIYTWVNGQQCARLIDDETSKGFIGLQVHSIGNSEMKGSKVKWRNIRVMTKNLSNHRKTPDAHVKEIKF